MTEEKKEILINNDSFCMLPFIHLYANPDGSVLPCCTAASQYSLGNLREKSISEIWNGAEFKELRKNILNQVKVKNCQGCYSHEKTSPTAHSFRKWANDTFKQHIDLVDLTDADGTMSGIPLRYYDIRWSNLCNYKCRTCGDLYSSSWAAENKKFNTLEASTILQHVSDKNSSVYDQYKPYLLGIENFYFAGGEPLITPEHYEILNYLIEVGQTDKKLRYNSNLSVLSYNKLDIIDLWKKFKIVELRASIDSWGDRAEYIRTGTRWFNVLTNMKRVKKELKNVTLQFNIVVSLLNILTLTDLLDQLIESELLDLNSDFPSLFRAIYPSCLTIRVLDPETKKIARDKIENWLARNKCSVFIENQINDVLAYLDEDHSHLASASKVLIDSLDQRRNENFVITFPELTSWYNQIK